MENSNLSSNVKRFWILIAWALFFAGAIWAGYINPVFLISSFFVFLVLVNIQ